MAQSDQPPNVLEVLDGLPFPATIAEMVSFAEDKGASEDVLDQIQAMPDRDYAGIHDVAMHLGRIEPLPHEENQWSSAPSEEYFTDEGRPVDTEHRQR
jgi:hypothetical protein